MARLSRPTWIILSISFAITVFFSYQYIYQEHRNIETEKAQYATTPQTLSEEFKQDALKSEKKHLNKTIEVLGRVTEVNNNYLVLSDIIFCQFNDNVSQSIKINLPIKVKGRCIGYDDLLEQVKLDQSLIIN